MAKNSKIFHLSIMLNNNDYVLLVIFKSIHAGMLLQLAAGLPFYSH